MSAPSRRVLSRFGITEGPVTAYFPLLESERLEVIKEVKGEGGPNTMLRWIQEHGRYLDKPGRAEICVTIGMVDRARNYAKFAGMKGGLQRRIPVKSMRRAGLVLPSATPLFGWT